MTKLNETRKHLELLAVALFSSLVLVQTGCSRSDKSTEAAADLGRLIFFDIALSADGKTSCASCHNPKLAFSDGRDLAIGVFGRQGTRNAPSLLNVPRNGSLFWDGRETRLQAAVTQPFFNRVELGLDGPATLISKMGSSPTYPPEVRERFRSVDQDEAFRLVGESLAEYVSSLETPLNPTPSSLDFRQDAHKGKALFEGAAGCSECHTSQEGRTPFTDYAYHNTGLGNGAVLGKMQPLLKKLSVLDHNRDQLGEYILSTKDIAELGRYIASKNPGDIAAFRTPSLQHVGSTAPYMHDGSISTLEEAVDHELYYRGLTRGKPIELTVRERRQLLAYLNTLGEH